MIKTTQSNNGRLFLLKAGDKVHAAMGVHTVEHDANGLFVRGVYDKHYLRDHGYRGADGRTLIGVARG